MDKPNHNNKQVLVGSLDVGALFNHNGDLYEVTSHSVPTKSTLAHNMPRGRLEEFTNFVPVIAVDKPFQPSTSGKIQDPDNYKFNWWPDKAKKDDTTKPRYDLLPPEALEEVVKVLTFGAGKYEDRNWEKGLTYGRCFAAAMRHLWAWWRGEDLDPESGLSHLAHAGCCVLFLLTYQLRAGKYGLKEGLDDRPNKG